MDDIRREALPRSGGGDDGGRAFKGPVELAEHEASSVAADAPPRSGGSGSGHRAAAVDAGPVSPSRDKPEELPDVPELKDADELARVLCALLLSQRDGLSMLRLAQACNKTQKEVEAGIERLREVLREDGMPFEVSRTGETVRVMTLPEVFPYLQRLRGVKKAEFLSPAALETLAVIAYRQPVMRAEIEAIRGVKAGPILRTLLDHKLIRITGRADVPGRPLQYGTTDHFLERFGLESLKDLPSIKEFKQLG